MKNAQDLVVKIGDLVKSKNCDQVTGKLVNIYRARTGKNETAIIETKDGQRKIIEVDQLFKAKGKNFASTFERLKTGIEVHVKYNWDEEEKLAGKINSIFEHSLPGWKIAEIETAAGNLEKIPLIYVFPK